MTSQVRVARGEVGVEPIDLPIGEVLAAAAQQPADLVQRIVLVAAPTEGFRLYAAKRGSRPLIRRAPAKS